MTSLLLNTIVLPLSSQLSGNRPEKSTTFAKMQFDTYFFRLDATQAAIIVGLFEIVGLLQVYLNSGLALGLIGAGIVKGEHLKHKYYDQISFSESDSLLPEVESPAVGALSAVLTLIFVILLLFPTMLTIGAVKGSRCLMLPWIIVTFIRAIFGVLMLIPIFAFPFASCAQFYYLLSISLFFGMTLYSLVAVCESYSMIKRSNLSRLALQPKTESASVQYRNF